MFTVISPKHIGWEPYVHLVWLIFLVFQPLFDPDAGAGAWGLIVLITALFLPVYFWTWSQKGNRALWGIGAMTLLGLVFTPLNSGSAGLFIYAAAALGDKIRPGLAVRLIGVILALVFVSALFSSIPLPYVLFNFLPIFIMTLLIGGVNLYYAAQSRTNIKLRMAQDELEHLATVAERERIGRDLHDLLGHTLSVITLKSELASKLIDKDAARAKKEMSEVERISREALSEVRSAVTGYRSKGFMGEIAGAKLALESAGVSFAFQGDVSRLTPLQESALSLVVREAVTNVIRHAEATRCSIALSYEGGGVQLQIADNGKGLKEPEGSGLSGIRERVQALGGRVTTETLGGLRLEVTLPVETKLERTPKRQLEMQAQ